MEELFLIHRSIVIDMINEPNKINILFFNFFDLSGNLTKFETNGEFKIPERYRYLHKNINKGPLSSRIDAWKKTLTKDEIFVA